MQPEAAEPSGAEHEAVRQNSSYKSMHLFTENDTTKNKQ